MKDIVLVISLLAALGLSVFLVRFAEKADKAGKSLEEERYSRMVAEETLQKNNAKLSTIQQQVKDDQNKMSKIADILDQEKDVNQNLKKQYDELSEAKANLESKLETVLHEKEVAVAALRAQASAEQTAPAGGPATTQATINNLPQSTTQPATQSASTGH